MQRQHGHSFKAILDRADEASRRYVKAEARGVALVDFFSRYLPPHDHVRVLDLGCGSGLISFALAQRYGSVCGVDREPDNIEMCAQKLVPQDFRNLHFVRADGFELPFPDASFDGAIVNGVLEWTGVNHSGKPPERRQAEFLNEVNRVLRPGGIFYVGIENRSSPPHLWRDPHTNIPLVCLLPRSVAEWFSNTFMGRPYQVYIYTPWQLLKLMERSGFDSVGMFAPVPGYQYPFHYVSLKSRAQSSRDVHSMDLQRVKQLSDEVGMSLDPVAVQRKLAFRARTGVLPLFARDIAAVATKR
jgi:SAM-dependent methyltransferase